MSQPKSNEEYKDTAERYVRQQLPELAGVDSGRPVGSGYMDYPPILLNHWVMLLGAGSYWWDLETRTLSYLRYQAQPSVAFNLITGQPATEADYKAFCEIVGITSEDKK